LAHYVTRLGIKGMKKINGLAIVLLIVISPFILAPVIMSYFKISTENKNRVGQIFAQEALLKEGDRLVDEGLYSAALKKYEEGLEAKYIAQDEDKRGPIEEK